MCSRAGILMPGWFSWACFFSCHRGFQMTQAPFQQKPLQGSSSQNSLNLELLHGPPSPSALSCQGLLTPSPQVQQGETLLSSSHIQTPLHLPDPHLQPLLNGDFSFSFFTPSSSSSNMVSTAALLETKLQISPVSQAQNCPTAPASSGLDNFLTPSETERLKPGDGCQGMSINGEKSVV